MQLSSLIFIESCPNFLSRFYCIFDARVFLSQKREAAAMLAAFEERELKKTALTSKADKVPHDALFAPSVVCISTALPSLLLACWPNRLVFGSCFTLPVFC